MKVNKQSGFSLLEILIAFSILALSLGILLKIFSAGVNTAAVAEEYTAAVQIAESVMAGAGLQAPLQVGETGGVENEKYHWRLAISPFQFRAENIDTSTLPVVLFKVKVNVNWDDGNAGTDGRQVELITLKLANKEL
ncbi:MAG: type II secretion system protein [Methylobacter sp.]|nr:type II secretion system protein [Methylobacter sp.]